MRAKRSALTVGIAVALMLAVTASVSSSGGITVQEADLNLGGEVYEINADAQGNLFISDYGAGEIWQVQPASAVYTVYEGLVSVSDARPDSSGDIWWTDIDNNTLGRVAVHSQTATVWPLTGAQALWGLALDAPGQVWMTDSYGPQVYRFDPTSSEVCTYTLPAGSYSDYIVQQAGQIWLGDWVNDRILKLDPAAQQVLWWQLEDRKAFPEGLAMDGNGNLWWADPGLGVLAHLEGDDNRLTTYALPMGTEPQMVAIWGANVWFSESSEGIVGALNPAAATGSSVTLDTGTQSVTPSCSNLGAGTTWPVTTRSGTLSWASSSLAPTPVTESKGWTVYQLPTGASPWGLARSGGQMWVTDQGRQKLLGLAYHFYLPLAMTAEE